VPYSVSDGRLRIEVLRWTPPELALSPGDVRTVAEGPVRGSDVQAVKRLVASHGPLHRADVARCIVVALGGKSLTSKWLDYAERVARAAGSGVAIRGEFLWPTGVDPASYWVVRTPIAGTSRDLALVHDDEIAAAHAATLARQLSMAARDLHRATARFFGIERVGQQVKTRLDAGLEALLRRGAARGEGEVVRWVGGGAA
jgi:hypothetical protein